MEKDVYLEQPEPLREPGNMKISYKMKPD
jgi:hypothetical protein